MSQQVEGRRAALGITLAPSTMQPQDSPSPWPEGAQGTESHLDLTPATAMARTYAVPAAGPGTAATPLLMAPDAWQP